MARLFIGLPVENESKWKLEAALLPFQDLRGAIGLRLVDSSLWHFTSVFLGDQTDSAAVLIGNALNSMRLRSRESENLICDRCLVKYRDGLPDMIWLTLHPASDARLKSIKLEVLELLKTLRIAFRLDQRDGPEHLTFARFGKHVAPGITENIGKLNVSGLSIDVSRVVLFESVLNRGGPDYTERAYTDIPFI